MRDRPGGMVRPPDHWQRRLLRARHERPGSCRAAEKRDEFAAPHSITTSAGEGGNGLKLIPSTRLPMSP